MICEPIGFLVDVFVRDYILLTGFLYSPFTHAVLLHVGSGYLICIYFLYDNYFNFPVWHFFSRFSRLPTKYLLLEYFSSSQYL
jgi:hypothetical protein